jgi:hypothetical protein
MALLDGRDARVMIQSATILRGLADLLINFCLDGRKRNLESECTIPWRAPLELRWGA